MGIKSAVTGNQRKKEVDRQSEAKRQHKKSFNSLLDMWRGYPLILRKYIFGCFGFVPTSVITR